MKPIQLKIKGLNSFVEEQIIDFEKLTSRGLFGIFGPTGSGKTSILDGITLSLYGEISRSTKEFINSNEDSASVSFEFDMNGNERKRYRVERAFKNSKTGGVTTKYARILQIENGEEVVIEERPTKVNEACEAIIGLTKEDFTRTVVLPQGKFSDFLKLKNKERGEMLERLFNLQSYGDELTAKLIRHGRQVKQRESELRGELNAYAEVTAEGIEAQTIELNEKEKETTTAQQGLQTLEIEVKKAEEIWQLQKEMRIALEKKALHVQEQPQYDAIKKRIDEADSANRLMPQVVECECLKQSVEALENESGKLSETREQLMTKHKGFKTEFEQITLTREEQLPKLQAEIIQLKEAVAEKAALAVGVESLEKMKRELETLEKQLEMLQGQVQAEALKQAQLEKQIHSSEAVLGPLKLTAAYQSGVGSLYQNLEQIESKAMQVEQLRLKEQELQQKVNTLQKTLESISEKQQQAQLHYNMQQTNIETLNSLFPNGTELLVEKANALQQLKNTWGGYERLQTQIEKAETQKKGVVEALKPVTDQIAKLEKERELLAAELERIGIEAQARQLRTHLVSGKACPVCGSTAHPYGHQIEMAIELSEDKGKTLSELEQRLKTLERQQIEGESNLKQLNTQLAEWQNELQNIGTFFLEQPVAKVETEYVEFEAQFKSHQQQLKQQQLVVQRAYEALNAIEKSIGEQESTLKAFETQRIAVVADTQKIEVQLTQDKLTLAVDMQALDVENIREAYLDIQEKAQKSEVIERELEQLRKDLRTLEGVQKNRAEELKTIQNEQVRLQTAYQVTTASINEKQSQMVVRFGLLDGLEEKLGTTEKTLATINSAFNTKRLLFEQIDSQLKQLEESYQAVKHQHQLQSENANRAQVVLNQLFIGSGFETLEQVKNSYVEADALIALKNRLQHYLEEGQQLSGAISQLETQLGGRVVEEMVYLELIENRNKVLETVKRLSDECVALKTALDALRVRYMQMETLILEKAKIDKELAQVNDLEKLFQGKRFVSYMAMHRLQYISGKASEQLFDISLGNFGLETDDEGNFAIRDYKNGGALRDPSSLSGGETFMVSLALALALSAQIQLKGTAPLEFFFLDEGFGTLDEDTLEVVMSALERLHHERLSIGLISHVESIKNRVPIKLVVSPAKAGLGGSRVQVVLS